MRGAGEEFGSARSGSLLPLCGTLLNYAGLKLFDSAVNCLRRSLSDPEPWSLYVSSDRRFSAPRSTNAFRELEARLPGEAASPARPTHYLDGTRKVLHAFTDEAIV